MSLITALMKTVFGIVLILFAGFFLFGLFGSDDENEKNQVVQIQPSLAASQRCADAKDTGVEYGITGSGINIREGPGTSYDKVINKKATQTLGKTHYVQVDYTVTVLEVCQKGGWSYVEVVKPDWLKESHRGWVASRFLRGQRRDTAGIRVFTEEDFIWDKNTSPYKGTIITGVNKIHRENERCKEIDPASAYLSDSRSTPDRPVFFVTCGAGTKAFNVWFSEEDLKSGKAFKAARHISQSIAIQLCEQYARQVATHPNTVDFSRVLDLAINEHANGRTAVHSTFSAKNSFNLEIKFRIRCLLDATGLIEATVNEAG
ncbi:SH3 domain-containing protein [Thalassospiraceae bacterium LMO-SO8]|nr:SH3 domain-containing protein [Alphaproteobacteria bacterium LMO-S08]WND77879.1 SH3 domain-containing protein [Thalassospiraceae bacterium LMO-SO8]